MFLKNRMFQRLLKPTNGLMSASPRFPPTPTCWKAPREASGIKKRSVVPKRKAGFFFPKARGLGFGGWGGKIDKEKTQTSA